MKISLDSAALCISDNRFGNYTVTHSLVEAIAKIDKKNKYTLYSFCSKPQDLKLSEHIRFRRLHPKRFWLSVRVSIAEALGSNDIFFALNQAIPLWTSPRIFSFSHGLSYYFFKDLYPDSYNNLKSQLFSMMDRSEYIFVSSSKVKAEMDSIFLKNNKVRVIPFGIPQDMLTKTQDEDALTDRVMDLPPEFFLFVGTDHSIKNTHFLVDAFKIFSEGPRYGDFKLILVGAEFERYTKGLKNIISFKHVSRAELKHLYQKASGYLTSSLYESFNLPVLEALSQGCPVVGKESAIIPELKEYVYTADHVEEFVEAMKTVVSERVRKIPKDEIKARFSWDEYVWKLQEFYTKRT